MAGPEMIMPIAKGAMSAAQKAGSSGGGKGGGSGSGPSPEQAALAQYTYGENLLKSRAQFPQGLQHSTMVTQMAEGAKNKWAQDMAKAGDANMAAQQQANSQLSQLAQQQANQGQQSSDFSSGVQSTQGGSQSGSFAT
jgi:hypothetical protein